MTMRYYQGEADTLRGIAAVRISPRGTIYLSRVLCAQAVKVIDRPIRVGYDDQTREFALTVVGAAADGAYHFVKCGPNSRRISTTRALRFLKILPAAPLTVAATIGRDPQTKAPRIVAILPPPEAKAAGANEPHAGGYIGSPERVPILCDPRREREEGLAQPAGAAQSVGLVDGEVAAALDAASDYEDALDPDEALTFLPLKQDRRECGQCFWRRANHCYNSDSMNYKRRIAERDFCKLFQRKELVGNAVKKRDVLRGRNTQPVHKRPRIRCAVCGTEHAARSGDRPWAHDVKGTDYRVGRGDRARPCRGNEKIGTKV